MNDNEESSSKSTGSLKRFAYPADKLLNLWLSLPPDLRNEKFADTARAAQIVGVSRRTILQWIEAGELSYVSIGKRHEVYLDSLRNYLMRRANP